MIDPLTMGVLTVGSFCATYGLLELLNKHFHWK
jgi:hypothetical protein